MDHLSAEDRHKLIAQIKRHEGTKRDAAGLHIAYRCTAGALTIGYGHNLDANPVPGISAVSRLNDDQAERLLVADLSRFATELDAALPWARALSPARYAVLLDMAFNLGIKGLLGFRNTLSLIECGQYAAAGAGMHNSKWARQVGRRAVALSSQMSSGAWQ